MSNLASRLLAAMLACSLSAMTPAAPAFRILYHEPIQLEVHPAPENQRHVSFMAFGRQFDVLLRPNETMLRAVPADRSDILPFRGTLVGEPGAWVRMTQARGGWRGVVFDGQEMYAIAPASEIAGAAVQPLGADSGSAPVIYRFADALLPAATDFCEVLNADGGSRSNTCGWPADPAASFSANGPPANGSASGSAGSGFPGKDPAAGGSPASAPPAGSMTAAALYRAVVHDLTSQPPLPSLRLTVGVVADYEFFQQFSNDPEGTIIARMNVVDGIFSAQVGVKISLGPPTVLRTMPEPFTKTNPPDLLAQVRQYRGAHADQLAFGVTHLMTGRNLDGDIVGLAYLGSVCNGDTADSLSEGAHSTTMSSLIAAHELGHNFNAPHDGVPGACAATPQTFLMAPQINFSSQFSACSLEQIQQRIRSAQCLTPYLAPDVAVELLTRSIGGNVHLPFNLSFLVRAVGDDASNDVVATATLPSSFAFESAVVTGASCISQGSSVSCSMGTLLPGERRRIDLTFIGVTVGAASATLSVSSSNDHIAADNTAMVAIDLAATSSESTPAVSPAATSGSGGGGRIDLAILAALTLAVSVRLRQRPTIGTERVASVQYGRPARAAPQAAKLRVKDRGYFT